MKIGVKIKERINRWKSERLSKEAMEALAELGEVKKIVFSRSTGVVRAFTYPQSGETQHVLGVFSEDGFLCYAALLRRYSSSQDTNKIELIFDEPPH